MHFPFDAFTASGKKLRRKAVPNYFGVVDSHHIHGYETDGKLLYDYNIRITELPPFPFSYNNGEIYETSCLEAND